MSNFLGAIDVVLAHEGTDTNFWVNDPKDPGGETVWGWSMLTIKRLGLTPRDLGLDQDEFTPGCLKNVSKQTCIDLYRRYFWDKYGYSRIIDQTVATKIFDAAVNMGPSRAHVLAQQVAGVAQDGILGPQTIEAINKTNRNLFVSGYGYALANYYKNLVAAKPALGVFLGNWLRRASWGT